jgi:hypothetical protein
MNTKAINTLFLLLFYFASFCQDVPEFINDFNYGGSGDDIPSDIISTSDGGFIMCGHSYSSSNDVEANYGLNDGWVVKLSIDGQIEWQKNYGGSNMEFLRSILETSTGGFVFVGYSRSDDFDLTSNNGSFDMWLVKINETGDILWERTFGGSGTEFGVSVLETSDLGFITAGITTSSNGDVTSNNGEQDIWITRHNQFGELIWQKTYGGALNEVIGELIQIEDGNFAIAGSTRSNDGDVTSLNGGSDAWIFSIDADGQLLWEKTLGGSLDEIAYGISATEENGLIAVGYAQSSDGDIALNQGEDDFWVVRLNSVGDLLWESSFGGSSSELALKILDAFGDGFLISGFTSSIDGDLSSSFGGLDAWIIRIDENGQLIWERSFGGSEDDTFMEIVQLEDGSFRVLGQSDSDDGDVSGNYGSGDFWLVELGQDILSLDVVSNIPFEIYPNPTNSLVNINLEKIVSHTEMFLSDAKGSVLQNFSMVTEKSQIDMSRYPSGVYFIAVIQDGSRNSQPFYFVK